MGCLLRRRSRARAVAGAGRGHGREGVAGDLKKPGLVQKVRRDGVVRFCEPAGRGFERELAAEVFEGFEAGGDGLRGVVEAETGEGGKGLDVRV